MTQTPTAAAAVPQDAASAARASIAAAADTSCAEFRAASLSRRGLLAGIVGAGSLTAFFGSAAVTTAYAATRSAPATVVVVSLRGAADGMSLVVPHGDPTYYTARPRIAIPAHQLLAKDGFFGLHPNLRPLLPLWNAGQMAAVHATGLPAPNRSHFAAMEELEDADPGSTARVGWLNRLIGRDTYDSPLQAIQFGGSLPPTSLVGPEASLAADNVDDVRLPAPNDPEWRRRREAAVRTVWGGVRNPMGAAARNSLRAVEEFAPVTKSSDRPQNGATYPKGSDLGSALASAARTIRADVGAEIITVDHGDWDHHANLGTLEWGDMKRWSDDLAQCLAAFFADLGGLSQKVTVVCLSEFGRRTKENNNLGLDHGYGNVMLLFGAGVKGGYHGSWPGLENTLDNDLLVTTDYRSVLSEVVTGRLGASSAEVFPGFSPERVGAVTSL